MLSGQRLRHLFERSWSIDTSRIFSFLSNISHVSFSKSATGYKSIENLIVFKI